MTMTIAVTEKGKKMRLIDADALPRQKMLEACGNGKYEDVNIVYGVDVDAAPTIDPFKDKSLDQLMDDAFTRGYCKGLITANTIDDPFKDKSEVFNPVKHGRWLNMEKIYDGKAKNITEWQQAECSVCHKWHTTPYMYFFTHYNYCPSCGARMDGDDK